MSLKNKLNRLKPHIKSGIDNKNPGPAHTGEALEIPFREVWEEEQTAPFYFDGQYCLVREVTYPLDHKHGHYTFRDLIRAVSLWNEGKVQHPLSAAGHGPEDLVFFDTETTGLGGGTGNTIFLLGHASISKDTVRLKQHILPQPGAEVALYQSFLQNADYTTLVTYNGKAFDWPQVKTRHTLVRDHVPKLPAFGHFDLYHAARRMWKHKIEKMKLSIVEQEVLGFERKDDIPGFLAPMIYFDFIERKNPEGMLGVIKHNEKDILSLLTLYTHLTFQLLGTDGSRSPKEAFEAGRWFSYLGDTDQASRTFMELAEKGNEQQTAAKHALAFEFKKKKEWAGAVELWEEIAKIGTAKERLEACIELAKHYEHREKNLDKALDFCMIAQPLYRDLNISPQKERLFSKELTKRIERINRKRFPG